MLALYASGVQAQPLGRLFSTPDERAALDQLRQEREYGTPLPTETSSADRVAPAPDVTVNGVVLRSGGPDTSWINGSIITSGGVTPEGVRVETGRAGGPSVRIVLPGSARAVRLKPGQKIDVLQGRVLDAYETEATRGEAIEFDGDRSEAGGARERTTAGGAD